MATTYGPKGLQQPVRPKKKRAGRLHSFTGGASVLARPGIQRQAQPSDARVVETIQQPSSRARVLTRGDVAADVDYALYTALSSPEFLTPRLEASIDRALEERKVLGLREFLGLLTR